MMLSHERHIGGHYLLSAQSRTLKLREINRLTPDEAFTLYCKARFADTAGEPTCSICQMPAYKLRCRREFKCKNCGHRFSATSGTHMDGTKLPYEKIVHAVVTYAMSSKGTSAIDFSHRVDISYKTAFVLMHRFREAVATHAILRQLENEVEIDCCVCGGYIKPKNVAKFRKDRRKIPYRSDDRLFVVIARERPNPALGMKGRSITSVVANLREAKEFVKKAVSRTATVFCDLGPEWSDLRQYWDLKRINHKYAYSTPHANTNMAESFFSMLRRMEFGTYHHISWPHYTHAYSEEMAWRQNVRAMDDWLRFQEVLYAVSRPARSSMKGYYQKRGSDSER